MKSIIYLSVVFIFAGLMACNRPSPATKEIENTQEQIDSLKQQKQELTTRLEDKKKKIDDEITELREKRSKSVEKKAREMYDESINKLTQNRDSLQVKIDRF